MQWLLTWPTFGTWLPGPARGWVDRWLAFDGLVLPEPDTVVSVRRRSGLKWPAVQLGPESQQAVIEDLHRIAPLRDLDLQAAVVAEDHVHLLLGFEPNRELPRIVQLVKGALSRKLSISSGDAPSSDPLGRPLPIHKWWQRQYSALALPADAVQIAQLLLRSHPGRPTSWFRDVSPHPAL